MRRARRSAPVIGVLVLLTAGGGAASTAAPGVRQSAAEDFAGRWEAVSDDGTAATALEIEVSGGAVMGVLIEIERGYFSSRESVTGQYSIRGSLRDDRLDVMVEDPSSPGGTPIPASIFRRGEYLVIRLGRTERGLARPGRSIVSSADGSAAAAALARAIAGRVYSAGTQAAGGGAFVGGRVRLALCADGRIELDASNLAMTPGAVPGSGTDLGGTLTRRGVWSVVMLAGAPAVRAVWQGTGSSYALTAYFVIQPAPGGASALVDGTELAVTGGC